MDTAGGRPVEVEAERQHLFPTPTPRAAAAEAAQQVREVSPMIGKRAPRLPYLAVAAALALVLAAAALLAVCDATRRGRRAPSRLRGHPSGLFDYAAIKAMLAERLNLMPTGPPREAAGPVHLLPWALAVSKAEVVEALMTPAERASLLHGVGMYPNGSWWVGVVPGVERLGIPALKMQDAGQGFRTPMAGEFGTVVSWPSLLTLASSWDEDLVRQVASAIADEFVAKGANVLLGPAINVHRSPLGGRNWEYISGEDPFLGSRFAAAYIEEVQSKGIMCVAKHFAFNEQETQRMSANSVVDEKVAWELYYPPFEAAVRAGVGAFMCSYNKVNGAYACENNQILNEHLKGTMGFRGFVMSDWDATHSPQAIENGLDLEMPGGTFFNVSKMDWRGCHSAVRSAVRRLLAAIFHLRLDERPGCEPPCWPEREANVRTEAHLDLALQAATDGIVLLQNDGTLPFTRRTIKKLAVLGAAADAHDEYSVWNTGSFFAGGGSGHVYAEKVVAGLWAIQERAAKEGIEVVGAANSSTVPDDADAVIVITGTVAGEETDRASLRLDPQEEFLIQESAALRPTVVLMQVPGAIVVTPWASNVAAVACMFYGGEQTGRAWASVIFGDVGPSGKLPVTFPATEEHVIAPQPDTVVYDEGLLTSYRSPVLAASFPFGHGLTYTKFEMRPPWQVFDDGPAMDAQGVAAMTASANKLLWTKDWAGPTCGARACVSVPVINVGHRPGREVVQVYVDFQVESLDEPRLVLKGFRKTTLLQPGAQEDVLIRLTERDLSRYDEIKQDWVLQKQAVLHIGVSSADIRQTLRLSLE